MKRLSNATLGAVRAPARTPAYDRAAVTPGVLHFGPGAFHRAHQACYFDDMLAHDPGYGIAGVSLRSPDVRDALSAQDGLYTVVEQETKPAYRVVGSLTSVLVAPEDPEAVFAHIVSPDLRMVTITVTEKGYCLTTGGELDLDHPEIRADLRSPRRPKTVVGWLVEGARRRWEAGLDPVLVLSCDNLSGNGEKLQAACVAFAHACKADGLAARLESRTVFPNTMVDSITPATDDALRADVAKVLGLEDVWPVQRERYVQWVVEDCVGEHREAFARAGVTLAQDVGSFERAKLRLLNGAHSTLAYVGLGLGYQTVSQAMADKRLAGFVERMMRQDVAEVLQAPELDVQAYIGEILARFRNPAIVHKLSQIAWDGSQKLRFRLLETAAERLAMGWSVDRLAVGVAAWIRFVRAQADSGEKLVDPLALELSRLVMGTEPDSDVSRFLSLQSVFPPGLVADRRFRAAVATAHTRLGDDPAAALAL